MSPHGLDPATLRTPALVVSADAVDANVRTALALLEGTGVTWRPHVKTVKLAWTMSRVRSHGLTAFKCATPRELEVLCGIGAEDVIVSYPHGAPNAAAVRALADAYPATRVSSIVDDPRQVAAWAAPVSLYVDLDVGMGRGGIPVDDLAAVEEAVASVDAAGIELRGLHAYDGHLAGLSTGEREDAVAAQLAAIARVLERLGRPGLEVVTSGTPTFVMAAQRSPFANLGATHAVAPGTVTYADLMTFEKHPDVGFRAAATVVGRVVSERPGRLIVDAGTKAMSVDQGIPQCAVVGHPTLEPERASEEHLPVRVREDAVGVPRLGDLVELVPRHVCTTVANFDAAVLVDDGPPRVERNDARGRLAPL